MHVIYLDTHVVVWLYAGLMDKLPDVSKIMIESNDLVISPAVILEIQYLKEINRINIDAMEIVNDLQAKIGLQVDDLSFEIAVQKALDFNWTSDPFDRLIAACSYARSYPLITKDKTLLKNLEFAIWDTTKPLVNIQ